MDRTSFTNLSSAGLMNVEDSADLRAAISEYYEVYGKRLNDNNALLDKEAIAYYESTFPLQSALESGRLDIAGRLTTAQNVDIYMRLPSVREKLLSGDLIPATDRLILRVVDYKDIDTFGDKIVLVCTGSQGEPLAALSRIANGDHEIQVGKGDTVVLASSLIPGNEKSVYRVINELTRFGAHVVHKGNAMVHVSGHASAGELLHCYEVVKPKNVLPVHGEWRHMRANADLAMKSGLSEHNVVIAENGITIDVANGHADISGSVPCGYVYVDGQSVGEITESSLKDRRILGDEGFISVVVVIDSQSGKIVAGPDIHARGFTEDKTLFDDVKGDIEKALSKAVAGGFNGTHQLSQVVRKTIGSWVGEEHRRKPMIIPLVVEV